jgi:type II secretory pathway predicted ATPase ExeA
MNENFFGMEHTPLSRDVPPEKLFESAATSNILGRLGYAADRQLFAVLTADAGCGNSTIIRKFASSLSRDEYILLYLSDSKLTPSWLYKGMLRQLGLEPKYYRSEVKDQLRASRRYQLFCIAISSSRFCRSCSSKVE